MVSKVPGVATTIVHELQIEELKLQGAFLIEPKEFLDKRGAFIKLFNRQVLDSERVKPIFVEEYLSVSKRNVIRGLHYQVPPYSQAKLVRCAKGSVFDVIVDLRRGSKTFGHYYAKRLSEDDVVSLFVPKEFAHGFLALEDSAVSYLVDNDYAPQYERGVIWNDTTLKINWPKRSKYIVSERDSSLPTFEQAEKFE
ncbi:MAG: dTDP-4-dehydrorhamnose 3,5-epimerase [Candidatus Bathyarchaeia archaeon]